MIDYWPKTFMGGVQPAGPPPVPGQPLKDEARPVQRNLAAEAEGERIWQITRELASQ